jgi:hypothetical protein
MENYLDEEIENDEDFSKSKLEKFGQTTNI